MNYQNYDEEAMSQIAVWDVFQWRWPLDKQWLFRRSLLIAIIKFSEHNTKKVLHLFLLYLLTLGIYF